MKEKFDLTHARHDPAHCLAPGLFRSLMRGERKKMKLDITHKCGDDVIRYTGFEPLGADDMRLLQGLIAMAGPEGLVLSPEPKTESGRQLRSLLDPQFDAAEKDARVVKSTITHLLQETGIGDCGDNIRAVIASLHRMANITVLIQRGSRQAIFHLLSYALDTEDGKLLVALNPRITDAVIGARPNTHIDMAEVRALRTDPTRFIHQRLCGWIDPGKSGRVEIATLCGYVWPDAATDVTLRQRRVTIRKSILELLALGWTIDEYAQGKYTIGRPAATRQPEKASDPEPDLPW